VRDRRRSPWLDVVEAAAWGGVLDSAIEAKPLKHFLLYLAVAVAVSKRRLTRSRWRLVRRRLTVGWVTARLWMQFAPVERPVVLPRPAY